MNTFSEFFVFGFFAFQMFTNGAEMIAAKDGHKKIKVSLFYESYCPFSVKFIEQQLYPTMIRYHNYMEMDLVPFGHCQTKQNRDGNWDFKCQHGEKECYGNRVHACVIEQGKGKDDVKTIITVACLMNFNYADEEVKKCLNKTNFSWMRHKQCMEYESEKLEIFYGKRTHTHVPKVKYVPFLLFDDVHNKTIEHLAVNDMEHAMCDLLGEDAPDTCPNYNELY